eukprot:1161991-Pelagomonas_calceolata.AAC.2
MNQQEGQLLWCAQLFSSSQLGSMSVLASSPGSRGWRCAAPGPAETESTAARQKVQVMPSQLPKTMQKKRENRFRASSRSRTKCTSDARLSLLSYISTCRVTRICLPENQAGQLHLQDRPRLTQTASVSC